MNLVLTTRCAKKCSFCFTDEDGKNVDNEMSMEDVVKVFDNFFSRTMGPPSVKLLGGEPTQYSNFEEVLDLSLSDKYNLYPRATVLVSNLLFNKATQEAITKHAGDKKLALLVNGMELDINNRMGVFGTNLNAIVAGGHYTSLAMTLSDEATLEYHQNYIKFLIETNVFSAVNDIRIGLDLNNESIINNKKYGQIITEYKKVATQYKLTISFDCQVPPCVFEDSVIEEFVSSDGSEGLLAGIVKPESINKAFNCFTTAVDIMPDLSAEFCYQTIGKIPKIPNVLEFKKGKDVKSYYNATYANMKDAAPESSVCHDCRYYLKLCNGLCLGCKVK